MGVRLEGGCRVSGLRDGEAGVSGTLRAWPVVGRATGAERVSLRILDFASGASPALRSDCDDVWYVLSGEATLDLDGQAWAIGPDAGIYVGPGRMARVHNASIAPLVVASVRCPEPDDGAALDAAADSGATSRSDLPVSGARGRPPVVRLGERPRITTGDRWYVELVNDAVGCRQVTQFVGSIPPGRAPDHYHHYEEVIVVLAGRGVCWAGQTQAPIEAGTCIYLPRKQVHCLENSGNEALCLVGVFYPAGSPAARYDAGSSAADSGSTL